MSWYKQIFSVFVITVVSSFTLSATELLTFDNETLRERYDKLIYEFRCPKCQNQNVADSNAPISEDIREKTYELLHQGYEDQEIVDFMVDRYTEFVIYKPQLSIITIWLWVLPVVILLCGFSVLVFLVKRGRQALPENLTAEEQEKIEQILKEKP